MPTGDVASAPADRGCCGTGCGESGCCRADAAAHDGSTAATRTAPSLPIDPAATARLAAQVAALASATPRLTGVRLRAVEDADGAALTALVGAAYDEYACGPLDPDLFDRDLRLPASYAADHARRWWVVVRGEELVASVAHDDAREESDDPGVLTVELKRLYLAPTVRGTGLATILIDGVAAEARRLGAGMLRAWSDSRLVDAHARYRALGFTVSSVTRDLNDPAGTTEQHFALDLTRDPVREREGAGST
jgi:GNAT superfamily N-acetyltransferase